MLQKKLMLLGGLRYLLPVIEAAHKQGYYVITCDYLPNNIAHKYSDEYHNVSIIDKEAILTLAKKLQIDGVMSFAVDPGVLTASYVQEKMGLPAFGPYESVCILQNKDRFRDFLTQNGFNVPKARGFASLKEALAEKQWYSWPVIVKPTDSAGSKGVTRVDRWEELKPALETAFAIVMSLGFAASSSQKSSPCILYLAFDVLIQKRWLPSILNIDMSTYAISATVISSAIWNLLQVLGLKPAISATI